MTLTVIGAGYVGLVTAAVFSELGNKVFCVDISQTKINDLKRGKVPFFEPSLPEYIDRNLKAKRLNFTTSYKDSVAKSQAVFICVGTPPKENGDADLSYLFSAVEQVAKNLSGYTLIIIKSTIPIGYENDLESTVKKHAKAKFEFAASPEFLREGSAIEDTLNPDRIVIGTHGKRAQKILLELHAPISGQRIICDIRSAQLIKYGANALLATKVSFANSLAILCEKMNANVASVIKGIGADKRIGPAFLYPGVGYGGSCLPKDVLAFISQANNFDYNFDLLKAVDSINNYQIERFINKIRSCVGAKNAQKANLEGVNVAILGLSFKPNTDDMRDAPSIKIINSLLNLKAGVSAFDPKAMENCKKIIPQIRYAADEYDAIVNCDVVAIVTEWPQFYQFDLNRAKKLLKRNIIVDGRNIFDPEKVKQSGFKYVGIGQ